MRRIALLFCGVWLVASSLLAADTLTLPECPIFPENEAEIPAQEAGVVKKILVHDGDQVVAGQLLAEIDDVIPRAQEEVAKFKLNAARKQADDEIDIKFATAARNVAYAEYVQGKESNAKVEGTVTAAEMRRRLLEWTKMDLSIEKAQKDMAVAKLQAEVSKAELDAATANVKRRQIVAPLDAVVIELTKHEGEWAENGAKIMQLVRIDRLRVQGYVNAKQYKASDLKDRPVTVSASLPGGQEETFQGKIVYIKPVIEQTGEFVVRAEIQNRKENGVWILIPGMNAKMTIQLK
jgi:multidrug efflux pump subunit AcrA (membrane-fusion protein)